MNDAKIIRPSRLVEKLRLAGSMNATRSPYCSRPEKVQPLSSQQGATAAGCGRGRRRMRRLSPRSAIDHTTLLDQHRQCHLRARWRYHHGPGVWHVGDSLSLMETIALSDHTVDVTVPCAASRHGDAHRVNRRLLPDRYPDRHRGQVRPPRRHQPNCRAALARAVRLDRRSDACSAERTAVGAGNIRGLRPQCSIGGIRCCAAERTALFRRPRIA